MHHERTGIPLFTYANRVCMPMHMLYTAWCVCFLHKCCTCICIHGFINLPYIHVLKVSVFETDIDTNSNDTMHHLWKLNWCILFLVTGNWRNTTTSYITLYVALFEDPWILWSCSFHFSTDTLVLWVLGSIGKHVINPWCACTEGGNLLYLVCVGVCLPMSVTT